MRAIEPPETLSGDRSLDSALRKSETLISVSRAFAVGLEEIGSLDLPPVIHGQIDQAQLRVIASLYLASDLEQAGIIPVVEQLSAMARNARLPINLGKSADLLADFWKARNERANEDERRDVFRRLFTASFEDKMLDLCEALYKLDEMATNVSYGGIAQQSRVRSAATRLLEGVADGGSGITSFLAQEITTALKAALAILGHPDLRAAFGARDVWGTVTGIDRMNKTKRPDPRLFVRQGRAGMTVLSWLADAAPHLENMATLLVSLDHPVIPAAVDWMETSLAIGETPGDVSQYTRHETLASASGWAMQAG
jgi:hypothetical protein